MVADLWENENNGENGWKVFRKPEEGSAKRIRINDTFGNVIIFVIPKLNACNRLR
jgi:hypothetical protein